VWLEAVRDFERFRVSSVHLRLPPSDAMQTLQDALLSLQRALLYERYGDYFEEACQSLGIIADDDRDVLCKEQLSRGYWTDLSQKLKEEEPHYKKYLAGQAVDTFGLCPTTMALWEACLYIGFNGEYMREVIHHYAAQSCFIQTFCSSSEIIYLLSIPRYTHGDCLPSARGADFHANSCVVHKEHGASPLHFKERAGSTKH
jgi:hypothetical protein